MASKAYRDSHRAEINASEKRRLQRIRQEDPERYKALMSRHWNRPRNAEYMERKRERELRWRAENREKTRAQKRAYYHSTPERRLASLLRARVNSALSGRRKNGSAVELLGVGIAEAKAVIERQFRGGMTWENWGEVWHLDHVRPLAAFDLTDAEQLAQACHIANLRPLEKSKNLAKGAKVEFLL